MSDENLLKNLQNEVQKLSERLNRIESKLDLGESAKSKFNVPKLLQGAPYEYSSKEKPKSPGHSTTRLSSGSTLAAISVFFFILAASFVIKLAIDSGWLTAERQLGITILLGLSMVASGLLLSRKDLAYSSLIAGGGNVVLFMAAYAGCLHFNLYDQWVAVGAAGFVSAISIILFREFRQTFYLVTAVVGTYLSALLFDSFFKLNFETGAFFLIWAVLFSILSGILKNRLVLIVASYFGIFVFSVTSLAISFSPDLPFQTLAIFQAIHFLTFVAGIIFYSIWHKEALTKDEAFALGPLVFVFYAFQYFCIEQVKPDLAPWIAIGFGLIMNILYFVSRKLITESRLNSLGIISTLNSMVLFHAIGLNLIPHTLVPWYGLGLVAIIFMLKDRINLREAGLPYLILALLFLAWNYLEVLAGSSHRYADHPLQLVFLGLILGAFLYAPRVGHRDSEDRSSLPWTVLLLLANIQILRAIDRLIHYLEIGTITPFVITSLWAALGLGSVVYGARAMDKVVLRSGVVLLFISAGKGLLFDVANAGSVIRIICLVVLGIALYAGGYFLRRFEAKGANQIA